VRTRCLFLLTALLPFLGSCRSAKQRLPTAVDLPPEGATAHNLKVFVRLETVWREHPALAVRDWRHPLPVAASTPFPSSAPLRAPSLSLDFARRSPDEPITPLYPAQRERAQARERAAIDAVFARAKSRESSTTRFYAEERQLALEDELEKLRARSQKDLHDELERERLATAEAMSNLRQRSLRAYALETAAEAAKRRAAVDAEMQKVRDQLAATQRQLEQRFREQWEREANSLRAAAARDIANAEERQRAAPLPDHEVQRRLLRADADRPSPSRLALEPTPERSPSVKLFEVTAVEPPVAVWRQSPRAQPDLRLVDEWSRKDTAALIHQWAKLHHFELADLDSGGPGGRVNGAVDLTDQCLFWLRATVWKKGS
jgi:hypothetical protein